MEQANDAAQNGDDAIGTSDTQAETLLSALVEEHAYYDARDLVRKPSDWEISRDHVVFSSICGLDTGKRQILHVLEPALDAIHGGVVLTAVGNTVQILKLAAPSSTSQDNESTDKTIVIERQYLFGFSGAGIGSLSVHPSKKYFAVGEKGVKPYIVIYRYPNPKVYRVLRNGTELSYSSVVFSQDGEKLASVGGAPDFLLTVWNWQQEQTILRCKAFGQEVFGVQFAPNDNGFLTTSGVGHIRLWKMASTFTGLKLQGDIGKFGKSELSDIEAFCVLPDKKVLSGTERGVLLLWDGNFIKCEIMTSRRHLPHAGAITVVQYDPETAQIVTAGKDGYVKFWSFDAIDRADVMPEDTVALVPMNKQLLLAPSMDIRAAVKQTANRYLIQDGAGSVHLLTIDGEEPELSLNYLANETGKVNGLACSPYEHIAASCGGDGSVRAWDYVTQKCLFTSMIATSPNGTDDLSARSPATRIVWVPNQAALLTEQVSKSRQVAVGFTDGLVRVFMMDLTKQSWVRTNVFKPHRARVSCMAFSASGLYFTSASDDATFFIFKVVPNSKNSKFAKYAPEYQPLGFQKVLDAITSICWRPDDEALLVTLACGKIYEYLVSLDELDLEQQNPDQGDSFEAEGERKSKSFELHLDSQEFAPFQRNRFMSVKELEIFAAQNPVAGTLLVDEKVRNNFHVEVQAPSLIAWTAMYASNKQIYVSCQSPFHGSLFLCQLNQPTPVREFASEETAHITALTLSSSKKLLLCGLSNGKFQLRNAAKPHAFLTGEFHDGFPVSVDARMHIDVSYDDSFAISAGSDGNLSVSRVYTDKLVNAARLLGGRYENLMSEAAIAGDQAKEKQQALMDAQQQAIADGKNNGDDSGMSGASASNDLSALPSFHRAMAFAAYIEARLNNAGERMAKDDEEFGGVVRLVDDLSSTEGVPNVKSTVTDAAASSTGGTLLSLLEIPDIQNPNDAYTIEDAKLKSEADAKAQSTRSKQDRTRDVLEHMRKQLHDLKALNATYPPESRLDDDEWEIDLDYGDLLQQIGDQACEEVQKELAFTVERAALMLMKMRETYVSPLAVELVTLHAFESGLAVQSFRTMKMPQVLQNRLNDIHSSEAAQSIRSNRKSTASSIGNDVSSSTGNVLPSGPVRHPSVLHIMAKETPLDEGFPLKDEERIMLQRGSLLQPGGAFPPPGAPVSLHENASVAAASAGSVHGFEARKQLRAERKNRLNRWMSNKPGEDADDPRDLVAITFAQRNMGDYKLKTSANYVVPEELRVNAAKKRRQMALLEEKLYEARLGFNAKVLELRELKVLLIDELKQDRTRLVQLKETLQVTAKEAMESARKDFFEVDLSEWPEQRERVCDADIEIFLREKRVVPHSAVTTSLLHNNQLSDGATTTNDGKRGEHKDRSIAALARKLQGTGASDGVDASVKGSVGQLSVRHILIDSASGKLASLVAPKGGTRTSELRNLDAEDTAVRIYLMKQEMHKLEKKNHDEIAAFDDAVAHLRREKMHLEVLFKKSELQLFTLLSELVLLEQLESKENLLSSKLEKNRNEKAQIVGEITEIQEHLNAKKAELEEWSKQEKAIQSEFLSLVNGGNASGSSASQHPCFAALQKIFKKKIKRPKKKATGAGGKDGAGEHGDDKENAGEEQEDEEEDEDDDDDYDEDDDDDDDDEEDVCPTGCELQLYERVLAAREKRVDIDEAMGDLSKAMDELKKSNDRQIGKQRQIDKELQATEQDIQLFQSEKQMRFNQLDVVMALSKQQIRCMLPKAPDSNQWELPELSTNALVFTTSSFQRLSDRIESLQKENKSLRQQFKDLHKQQNVLAKEKKVQQGTIAQIQGRCEQLQLLKFGQLVDIEVLDKACDTTKLNDLQAKVRVKEIDAEREVMRVKQTQQDLKREILHATEQNTMLLSQLAALNERQVALEKELNQANIAQSVLHDDSEKLDDEMRERNKLVKLVKLQAREMEALKQEIGLLRGKDGKVYAPRI